EDEPPVLFSGDTLFMAGCGRLFEGTPLQMYQSLQRLAALPAVTRVYCTHEYSLSNLKFAAAAEPDNPQVLEQLARVEGLRAQGRISLPGSIAQERAINPFLRCSQPAILATLARQNRLQDHDPVEVFTALRAWKDGFQA
ncbi:MAG: hydroxyacylglutathione hydrolase C-terminal domain-containing protein, partial [Thiopseudomonas sp.]